MSPDQGVAVYNTTFVTPNTPLGFPLSGINAERFANSVSGRIFPLFDFRLNNKFGRVLGIDRTTTADRVTGALLFRN